MASHSDQHTNSATLPASPFSPSGSSANQPTSASGSGAHVTTPISPLGPSVSNPIHVQPSPQQQQPLTASPTLITTTDRHVHPPPPGLASPVVIPMTATAAAADKFSLNHNTFTTHLTNSSVDSLMNDVNDPLTFTLYDKLYACLLDGPRKDFLSQLPYEIATYILQFLDMQHIVKVARISRTWHLLANDNEVWKCVFLIHRGWKLHLPNPSRQAPSGPFASMTLPKESKAYSALYSTSSSNLKNPFLVSSPTRLTSHASLTPPSPPPRVYWKKLCHDRLMIQQRWNKAPHKSRLVGHDDSVYCIQFDHEKIVTGSRDRTIKFWDIHTYQNTHTLKGHTQSVLCLQFNEHIMVSGSSDTTIIVWDMATRTKTHQLCGHTAGVLDVCFDDEYIVSCSKDATIKVWDVKTKKLLRTMVGHRGPVNAVQLHRGKVVSASGDGLVKLWNIETGVCERDFVGHERGLACVQFDGRTIVSGSNDRTIRIWNAATGECTKILRGHTNLVRTLHFSGTRIVSGSYDNSVKVWDMETGLCTLSLDKGGHESWVFDVQFSDTKIIR
ncbi:hypothetical protein BGW42_005544 [Actinomortierella wolfii]|nr:hypothetical protein BGW42_005544 [Actinomortierella wolfii]